MTSSSMNHLPSPAFVSADSWCNDFKIEKKFIRKPTHTTTGKCPLRYLDGNRMNQRVISMDRPKTNILKPYDLYGYAYKMEKKLLKGPIKLWSAKRQHTPLHRNTMHHNTIYMERSKATLMHTFSACWDSRIDHKTEREFLKKSSKMLSYQFPHASFHSNGMLRNTVAMDKIKKNSLLTLASSSSSSSSSTSSSSSASLDASGPKSLSSDTVESSGKDEKITSLKGIFPGGLRRAEVKIPGLAMKIRVIDVLGPESKEFGVMIDSLVSSGFTMVILQSQGEGNEDTGSGGGARLFEAARLLKNLLRGRATLLVEERVDIASATGVDGVLLSDEGKFFLEAFLNYCLEVFSGHAL